MAKSLVRKLVTSPFTITKGLAKLYGRLWKGIASGAVKAATLYDEYQTISKGSAIHQQLGNAAESLSKESGRTITRQMILNEIAARETLSAYGLNQNIEEVFGGIGNLEDYIEGKGNYNPNRSRKYAEQEERNQAQQTAIAKYLVARKQRPTAEDEEPVTDLEDDGTGTYGTAQIIITLLSFLLISVFLATPNITGNAIGGITKPITNLTAIIFFVLFITLFIKVRNANKLYKLIEIAKANAKKAKKEEICPSKPQRGVH